MRRRVLVVTGDHGRPDPTKWDGRYTADDLDLHETMVEALGSLPEYSFDFVVEHDLLIDRLLDDPPDLVLNFCDTGFHNVPEQELHLPALLELLGIPCTGAPPASLAFCYDKHLVGLVAHDLGIPVPRTIYLPSGASIPDGEAFYPALIKPVHADGSVGIIPDSVVYTRRDAEHQLAWLQCALPDAEVLWQEYLTGPELGLTLIGNSGTRFTALPPLEVDYSSLDADLPKILAFESKTGPETRYEAVKLRPARLPDKTLRELQARAERLFVRLQCRDYARFDFRADRHGRVKLLEVNPNPAWSSAAKMAVMARHAGMDYPDLLRLILDTAWARIVTSTTSPRPLRTP